MGWAEHNLFQRVHRHHGDGGGLGEGSAGLLLPHEAQEFMGVHPLEVRV